MRRLVGLLDLLCWIVLLGLLWAGPEIMVKIAISIIAVTTYLLTVLTTMHTRIITRKPKWDL